jgi:hypothetical protein
MESTLPDIQRGDELRYVTQHFTDLQGLRMAPFFAAFVVLSALEQTHAVSRQQAVWVLAGMLALAVVWFACAGRWYRERYGLVTPQGNRASLPTSPQVLSILDTKPVERRPAGSAAGWLLFCAGMAGLFLVPLFQHHPDGRVNNSGLMALIVFLLPKALYAGGGSLLTQGRKLLAAGGMATIVVLHMCYLLGRIDSWQYAEGTAGILLLSSLYDHWLLNHLLGGRLAEGRDA